MSLLEIKNLNVRFGDKNATPVVDGLDLKVDKGEVLAIVGESGSGKSVTMMALMGLIEHPGIVTADFLSFDGKDMLKLSNRQRRQIGQLLGGRWPAPPDAGQRAGRRQRGLAARRAPAAAGRAA